MYIKVRLHWLQSVLRGLLSQSKEDDAWEKLYLKRQFFSDTMTTGHFLLE